MLKSMLYMFDIAIWMQCAYDAWHSSRFGKCCKCCLEAEHDYWIKLMNLCTCFSEQLSMATQCTIYKAYHSVQSHPFNTYFCYTLYWSDNRQFQKFRTFQFWNSVFHSLHFQFLFAIVANTIVVAVDWHSAHEFRILNWEIIYNGCKFPNQNRIFSFVCGFWILNSINFLSKAFPLV